MATVDRDKREQSFQQGKLVGWATIKKLIAGASALAIFLAFSIGTTLFLLGLVAGLDLKILSFVDATFISNVITGLTFSSALAAVLAQTLFVFSYFIIWQIERAVGRNLFLGFQPLTFMETYRDEAGIALFAVLLGLIFTDHYFLWAFAPLAFVGILFLVLGKFYTPKVSKKLDYAENELKKDAPDFQSVEDAIVEARRLIGPKFSVSPTTLIKIVVLMLAFSLGQARGEALKARRPMLVTLSSGELFHGSIVGETNEFLLIWTDETGIIATPFSSILKINVRSAEDKLDPINAELS